MEDSLDYVDRPLTRNDVDAIRGPLVVDFGTSWCEHCQAAQPAIVTAMAAHRQVRRIKIEDGPGRPLGRSFGVKLWPTLVFLRDGKEVVRLVRPVEARVIEQALAQIDGAP